MPAPAVHTLFGQSDLKVDARFLSNIAFMASAEKPVETPTMIGDYAMSEMCVSDAEVADIKMYLDTLRSEGQHNYVSGVARKIRAAAASSRNRAGAAAADDLENEFARLAKVFFLRLRSYEVIRASTEETVGRIVCFPDQIADDYGNNLEERTETGIIQSMVDRARGADKIPTVYVGHGHGAAMAEICGCASGRQAIIFDGSILCRLLVQNAVAHKCVQTDPVDGNEPKDFNILSYRSEAVANKQDAVIKAIQTAARQYDAEEKAAQQAAEEEARRRGEPKKEDRRDEKKKAEEEAKEQAAADWIAHRECYQIGGIINAAARNRFERTGRYNAKALSDMLVDYTASVRPAADSFKQ